MYICLKCTQFLTINAINSLSEEQSQCFFIGLSCPIPTMVFYYFFISILSVYRLVLWGWGLRTDRVYITLSLSLALPTFFIDDNNNNYWG